MLGQQGTPSLSRAKRYSDYHTKELHRHKVGEGFETSRVKSCVGGRHFRPGNMNHRFFRFMPPIPALGMTSGGPAGSLICSMAGLGIARYYMILPNPLYAH